MARKKIKSVTDQRPFIMIYHDFLDNELLTLHEKMVFIALMKFADSNGQCFPSLKKLASIARISKRKVQDTLQSLEQKHIISIESRSRGDGGKSSNLYTLYDFKELWDAGSNEEMTAIADSYEEMRLVAELQSRGYLVTKEKGLTSAPAKVTDVSAHQSNNMNQSDNTINLGKSQERYTADQIRQLFDYNTMITDHPGSIKDIDTVFDILYDALNRTRPFIRIDGQDRPAMAVIGRLMRLEPADLWYAISKYHEQTGRIKNVSAYLLTILYHAREQGYLDLANLGHYNGDF